MTNRPGVAGLILCCLVPLAVHADGPADNLPDTVRPIPPLGIELEAEVRQRLSAAAEALARDVEALPAADAADRAEVLVFARAVRLAVEDRFLYSLQEVAQAQRLLEIGQERLRALAAGSTGTALVTAAAAAAEQPRLAVGGFRSRIDGSVQPYGLVLPAAVDAVPAALSRLDVWLHGRGEKLSEVAFLSQRLAKPGEIAPAGTIVLHPYGRYSNAFKFAGEVDVLEAIAHVCRRFAIDERRVTIRGFSMGGAGCWQFAVHYPGTWMAATPGAGFSETREFLRVFQEQDFRPSDAQARLLHWYDCPAWANNLRTLPTIAYSGELDRQKQAADVMVDACQARGFEIPHVIGAQTGHSIHPDAKQTIEAFVERQAEEGRPAAPREVDFTTFTLRYPKRSWLTVTGLGEHWREARVRARVESAREIAILTDNVTALGIDMPADAGLLDGAQPVEVRIDGSSLTVPVSGRATRWKAAFIRSPGAWRLAADEDEARMSLRKRPGLQGPIDDAFMDAFVFVGPEPALLRDSAVDRWSAEEYARAKREWRRHFRGDVVERRAAEVSAEDISDRHLVLFGTPASNPVIARVLPQLPLALQEGAWVLGNERVPAAESIPVMIYPNPLDPRHYVVLNSGFTFREFAYLNNARQIAMLPDWAFVSVLDGRDSQSPGTVLAEGFFDEAWRPRTGVANQP